MLPHLQASFGTCPSGLLYYNDTAASRIYVFDCDEAGLPVHDSRRVLREFNEDEGSPDVRWSDLMALGCHTYVT